MAHPSSPEASPARPPVKRINRRLFLSSGLAAAASISIVAPHVLGGRGRGYTAPNDRITRAVIGAGGMARAHINYLPDSPVLAVCDVDRHHLDKTLRLAGPDARGYEDFREVLARPDIDMVHIVTPPHWHALMAIAAAKAGKDIWCEKPMTRTIAEGQALVRAVQENQSIFRLNTWFRFKDNFYGMGTPVAPIKKLVDSGMLGWPLKVTLNRSTGFNWKFHWIGRTDLTSEPVPSHLNYDFWLGPAPFKPYHPHRVHGSFRGYWDYDGGGLGDMGQHYLDPVQYLLGKDNTSPVYVEADAPPQDHDAVGTWRRIWMKYADGCEIVLDGDNTDRNAAFLEGPNGKLYRGFRSTIPNLEAKLAQFPDPAPQATDFVQCMRRREPFALNESNGHFSCTLVNLGKIALRTNRSIRFSPDDHQILDDPAAAELVNQPNRQSWQS